MVDSEMLAAAMRRSMMVVVMKVMSCEVER